MAQPAMQKPLIPDFREGVDRKLLKALVKRFMALNAVRLERLRWPMNDRQEAILDLLPLLLHVNHPMLPGFVSRDCPHKIALYQPSDEAIKEARRHSRTFQYRREPRYAEDILGLYLMGSTGSIAQHEGSDLDIWVCIRPGLDGQARQLLVDKCELITAWADKKGLEVHFFLMDADAFRAGRERAAADKEDCGSAQHFLLLDEFYRSSILLCGRYPLWWLVPAHLEAEYDKWATWLVRNRFVDSSHVIDFGSIARIPPEEFVGAGMWQLYKAIDAPFKSVLKLLLIEVYAAELPDQYNLSLEFKQSIYLGQGDCADLDAYVMMYQRIERYLKRIGAEARLFLARKCFYLKVAEKLTRKGIPAGKSWRRDRMVALTRAWGWGDKELSYLDRRHEWRVTEVLAERKGVVSELTHSYRFLSSYSRRQGLRAAIRQKDLNLLGRKLYAAFQRKAGKQEFINPNIAPSLAEERLAFHHVSAQPNVSRQEGWLLYRGLENASDALFQSALRRSNSLLELLIWSHYNGLLVPGTRLGLVPGVTGVSYMELRSIVHSIQTDFPMPLPALPQSAFRSRAWPVRILLFVNVGVDPLKKYAEKGLHKVSNRVDSLGYSDSRENLVRTIDQVTLNTWNEVTVNRYELGDTLIQCLKNHLAQLVELPERQARPVVHVYCFDQSRATAIARRVGELFADVEQVCFTDGKPSDVRYLVELDQRYFLLEFVEQQPRFTGFESIIELFEYLAQPLAHAARVVVDRYALLDKPRIRAVVSAMTAQSIQVFYYIAPAGSGGEPRAEVYVIDERGAFFTYSCAFFNESSLIGPLFRFLNAVSERRQMHADLDAPWIDTDIVFYRLVPSSTTSAFRPVEVNVTGLSEAQHYFDVQAIGNFDAEGELYFDIYVDHHEFTYLEYGKRLIPAVAHYILSRRKGTGTYPCYITDLGLPHDLERQEYQIHLQTVQYLKFKHHLESALNRAIQEFS